MLKPPITPLDTGELIGQSGGFFTTGLTNITVF